MIRVSPRDLIAAFGAGVALVHAANLFVQISRGSLCESEPCSWVTLFDVDAEANVPTWFSSVLLLTCAVSSWAMSRRVESEPRKARGFRLVATLLGLFSIDEVASVHERVAAWMLITVRAHDIARIWVWGAGGVIVAALFFSLAPFLAALDRSLRSRLVASGVIFVMGALVLEAIGHHWAAQHGFANATYAALSGFEELLEMLGALFFLQIVTSELGAIEIGFDTQSSDPHHDHQ